jgi:cell division protein FtsW (lipid II flippase)
MSNPNDVFDTIATQSQNIDVYVVLILISLVIFGLVSLYYISKIKGNGYKSIVFAFMTALMCILIWIVHDYGFIADPNIWYLFCFGIACIFFMLFITKTYKYITNHPEYIKAKAKAEARSLPPRDEN